MGIGVNIAAQTLLFCKSIALGACLMLLYDVFRILRLAVRTPPAVVLVQDLIYFTVCAVASFLFLVSANYGEVRVFALLGEAIGALLCFLSVSQVLMACSRAIIGLIEKLIRLIWIIFLRPVYLLIRWISRLIVKIADGLGLIAKKSLHKANYSLKRRRIMLYNLIASGRRNPHGTDAQTEPTVSSTPAAPRKRIKKTRRRCKKNHEQ